MKGARAPTMATFWIAVGVFGLWLLLQLVVLPRLGVPT